MWTKHLACLLILLSNDAVCSNITVYRWVDENNVVHFSQYQPPHENYIELTMLKFQPSRTDVQASLQEVSQNASEEISTNFREKCAIAKANLKTLTEHEKVQFTGKDGQTKILDAKEKLTQIAISEKQAEVYCQ